MRKNNMKLNANEMGLEHPSKHTYQKAIGVLNEAFHNDPCLLYLLDSKDYNREKAKYIHELTLKLGIYFGTVLTTSRNFEGISIWMPPSRVHTKTWMFLRAGGLKLKKYIGGNILEKFEEYGNFSKKIHNRIINKPHWYLLSLAVRKEDQGKGYSKKMIIPVFDRLDNRKLPCYLETHNPKNLDFYYKLGFTLAEKGILPNTDITHYAMIRKPKLI